MKKWWNYCNFIFLIRCKISAWKKTSKWKKSKRTTSVGEPWMVPDPWVPIFYGPIGPQVRQIHQITIFVLGHCVIYAYGFRMSLLHYCVWCHGIWVLIYAYGFRMSLLHHCVWFHGVKMLIYAYGFQYEFVTCLYMMLWYIDVHICLWILGWVCYMSVYDVMVYIF